MVLILLISNKAVNILFFNSSLQMNNFFLYKPNYTSTKALERKCYLTATYTCHLTRELHNCIKFSHMKLLYGFLSRGRKSWDSSTANDYTSALRAELPWADPFQHSHKSILHWLWFVLLYHTTQLTHVLQGSCQPQTMF